MRNLGIKTFFILAIAVLFCLLSINTVSCALEFDSSKRFSASEVKDFVVWAIYEPVYTKQDLKIVSLIKPDILVRAWLKWGYKDLGAFTQYSSVIEYCHKLGIAFQGGTTCKVINTKFANFTSDMAACGQDNKPISVDPSSVPKELVFMNMYDPKAMQYVLKDAKQQIDLGADGIWFDEVGNFYNYNKGIFDDIIMKQFSEYLVNKYVKAQGWSLDDERWKSLFKIDLSDFGSNIANFNLKKYLERYPKLWRILNKSGASPKLLSRSDEAPMPILKEFGYPNEWYAKEGTFYYDYTLAHWKEIALATKEYAQKAYGFDPIITKNMINFPMPYVSFQQPQCVNSMFPLNGERLDATQDPSQMLDDVMRRSFKAAGDVPIVWFVDWPGQINELLKFTPKEQKVYFRIYSAQAYAHGQFFALPFRAYLYDSQKEGTFSLLLYLSKFYQKYKDLFLHTNRIIKNEKLAQKAASLNLPMILVHTASLKLDQKNISSIIREKDGRIMVHLINHNYSFSRQSITPIEDLNLILRFDFNFNPKEARLISPDLQTEKKLDFSQDKNRLTIKIPQLEYWDIIVLQ